MNWFIISIVVLVAIVIVVFTLIRNNKEKDNLERKLNNDFKKKSDRRGEIEKDFM